MAEEEGGAIKVVLVGEAGVGKTCIISQFTENKFDPETVSSLTTQYKRKIKDFPDGKQVIFDLYDTAGQERFRSIARIYYKNAKVVVLVYDITSKKTFEEMKGYWYQQVKDIETKDLIIAIAANKSDLYEEREVEDDEGKEFATSIKAIFVSTSAKNDSGITALFDNIGQKLLNPDFDFDAAEKKKKDEYNKRKMKEENLNAGDAKKVDIKNPGDKKISSTPSFRVTSKKSAEKSNEKKKCC